MSTLYELTGQYQYLLNLMEDPEADPQLVADSLEALTGDIEAKADGYAKVHIELKAQRNALKAEVDRLMARIRAIDRNDESLIAHLQMNMLMMEIRRMKTDLFTFSIQKNPPKLVHDCEDYKAYDPKFRIQRDPDIDWKKIKEALADPDEAPFLEGLVHMEQGESLRIR